MQPILTAIFYNSSFKQSSVSVPGGEGGEGGGGGGCTALFISDPVATQNTGFLMTSSSKIRKKKTKTIFDLCFTVCQDFFHSIINKVRQKEKNCPRKPPPKHSLICLMCALCLTVSR